MSESDRSGPDRSTPDRPGPDRSVRDHLALALVPGLGPKLTAALLERFGSAAAALRATAAELREIPQVGEKSARLLADALRATDPEPELRLLADHGAKAVPLGFAGYPTPLAGLADPPPLLYLRGEWTEADLRAVAVVGTRQCTAYGERVATRIARELARAGFTIVSGLARGIDGAAHRAALEAGGRTIAVLAGGLARVYPPEHTELAERIAAGNGCLVSETPMGMAPQPGLFPGRNRIISGLSRAVVVVEADSRSGALITARHAAEQGREVFAVPGPVDAPSSAGCLALIRSGARLVRSADDVIEDLNGIAPPLPAAPPAASPSRPRSQPPASAASARPEPPDPSRLTDEERQVYDTLSQRRHGDELVRLTGLAVSELTRVLMRLELKKVVRRLPGNFYERR